MQPAVSSQNGSALIAVIAFLALASVFLSLGLDFLELRSPQEDVRRTVNDMNLLTAQLSSYVQKNNRLPCPASPAQLNTNANFGRESTTAPGSQTCTITEGLLPARTLYLPETFMKDSWGQYYTYAVSPAYADTTASANVYSNCRVNNVWVYSGFNINVNKARFCCPDVGAYSAGTDLNVTTFSGAAAFTGRSGAGYTTPNIGTTPGLVSESAAFVLVSHGPDGSSAFLPDGSGGKYAASFSANEAENGNGDRQFIQGFFDNSESAHFDDLVAYKGQLQLMAYLNDGSCMRPFFSYTPDLLLPPLFTP